MSNIKQQSKTIDDQNLFFTLNVINRIDDLIQGQDPQLEFKTERSMNKTKTTETNETKTIRTNKAKMIKTNNVRISEGETKVCEMDSGWIFILAQGRLISIYSEWEWGLILQNIEWNWGQ